MLPAVMQGHILLPSYCFTEFFRDIRHADVPWMPFLVMMKSGNRHIYDDSPDIVRPV